MTRSELAVTLMDLLQRKAITAEEAAKVLRLYDNGELSKDDLPLSVEEQEAQDSRSGDRWIEAAALLYLLLGTSPMRALDKLQRERARKLLRLRFEASVAERSALLDSDSLASWQRGVAADLSNYTRQMAITGAGKTPGATTKATVDEQLSAQWPYLLAFATQILARRIGDRPMSETWVTARSVSYGGPTGWASYFIANEEGGNVGWVSDYISRDDNRVCSPCSEAQRNGPYLLGEGPVPGSVCLGAGKCRCERKTIYDPVAYARLSGRR